MPDCSHTELAPHCGGAIARGEAWGPILMEINFVPAEFDAGDGRDLVSGRRPGASLVLAIWIGSLSDQA